MAGRVDAPSRVAAGITHRNHPPAPDHHIGDRPTAEAHLEVDERLHDLIAAASGSALLRELVGTLKVKTRMFDNGSIPERFEPGCHEHIAIIDAILARDPARAEAQMRGHLENARAAILTHLARLF